MVPCGAGFWENFEPENPDSRIYSRQQCSISNQVLSHMPQSAAVMGELGSRGAGEDLDDVSESVDELREKLANMKRDARRDKRAQAQLRQDGNFLSWIFGTALAVILSVSFYAFYNLYNAVLKKFPAKHTEL